jgi:hypothetical protein
MIKPSCLVAREALPLGTPRDGLLLIAPFRLCDGTAEGVLRVRNLPTSGREVWNDRGRVGVALATSVGPHRTRKPVAGTMTRMGLRRG